jgi:hypothetical protein
MELKLWRRCHLQWHDLPAEFRVIYKLIQKMLVGDTQKDRLTGDLISLPFIF